MTMELTLKSELSLEFAIGKVAKGKKEWMYGEYFAEIGPVMAEHGVVQLATFAVISTNAAGVVPEMGSINNWPSIEACRRFHNDPRFMKIKPARDEALELLSDGHFFQSVDKVVHLDNNIEYSLVIADGNKLKSDPALELLLEKDSRNQAYSGKSMTLQPWGVAAEQLMAAQPADAEVYRIRFNQ